MIFFQNDYVGVTLLGEEFETRQSLLCPSLGRTGSPAPAHGSRVLGAVLPSVGNRSAKLPNNGSSASEHQLPGRLAVGYCYFLPPRGCASLAALLLWAAALLGNWLNRAGASGSQRRPRLCRPSSTSKASSQAKVCEDQGGL